MVWYRHRKDTEHIAAHASTAVASVKYGVGILATCYIVDSEGHGEMRKLAEIVTGLNIYRQIEAEIIRYSITVALAIVETIAATINIFGHRNGYWTTCRVVEVDRYAISVGKFVVAHQFEVVRFVVRSIIPLSIVDSLQAPVLHFPEQRSGIGV